MSITVIYQIGYCPGWTASAALSVWWHQPSLKGSHRCFTPICLKLNLHLHYWWKGASGGALGIGVGNKVYMLENTWYTVIAPESCSSILWRNWDHKEDHVKCIKPNSERCVKEKNSSTVLLKNLLGGAHYDPEQTYLNLKASILQNIKAFSKLQEKSWKLRDKNIAMGQFKG